MNIPKLRFKDNNGNDYPQWEKKKLGDIVQFLDNKRKPLEQSERIHGKYPYYGASGIIDYINNYIFDEELVLLSEDGANIIDRNYPICYIATGKYWVNNHAHVLKTKSQYLNKFLCEALERLNYNKYNTGTAQPKLNQDICKNILLNIPILHEQEKIANFFSTIDKKIKNLANTITSLENQKKGLLQQIFSQKLRFKDENGNNYPNWEKKKLGKLLSITSSKRVHEADWTTSGIPFYRARDIVSIFNNKPISKIYISEKLYEECSSSCGKISENDLLVTGVGTIGIPYLVKKSDKFYFKDGNIIWLKNSPAIYGKYLFYIFISSYVQKQINMMTGKGTVGTYTIKNAKDTNILLPCLEEQTKIADFLSEFDRKLDNQKAQLEHWQQIKKGLLQQMFV
ncbi:restriction endonuclease subunit S [Megamonas funiformis]|uniref:restriction endonuclease subunit S n=3 Tax=Megamonas TaxID=158846 RepID=UPI0035211B0F